MNKKFYHTQFYRFAVVLFFIITVNTLTIAAQPILSLTPVIETGLTAPIQFVNAGDGSKRVFIVEKSGTIKVYDSAFNFLSLFVTVSGVFDNSERGLLSMAFHHDYRNNGFFYVYYVNLAGNLEMARYHVSSDANVADAASKVIVITIPHPTNSNHNGGELHFGSDGYLYLSTGDGGGGGDVPNNAQNTSVLLGKMLRFNVNTSAMAPFYTIPAGNPFGNEIFDLGLRNPFRWSFDRLTNDMWIGDVGQDSWEEINYRAAGATGGVNYGWRCYEGNNTYNTTGCGPSTNYVFPAYTYPTQNPSAAITGGLVYRGTASPDLQGYYIAADFYSGLFYMIHPDGMGGWTTDQQVFAQTGMVDFGETEDGEAYVLSLFSGGVYRISAVNGAPVPVILAGFSGSIVNKQVQLHWQTSQEQNLQSFDIEYSHDGASFVYAATVQARNVSTGADYSFTHVINVSGTLFYRLKMKDANGRIRYSGTIKVNLNVKDGLLVSPSVIADGVININLTDAAYSYVEVVSTGGAILIKRNIEGQTGRVSIPAAKLSPGVYIVRLVSDRSDVVTQKILVQ